MKRFSNLSSNTLAVSVFVPLIDQVPLMPKEQKIKTNITVEATSKTMLITYGIFLTRAVTLGQWLVSSLISTCRTSSGLGTGRHLLGGCMILCQVMRRCISFPSSVPSISAGIRNLKNPYEAIFRQRGVSPNPVCPISKETIVRSIRTCSASWG